MSVEDQKRVLLAAITEAAENTGHRHNPVPLQAVGQMLWPRRDDDDPELLALVDALAEDGELEPSPLPGHAELSH